MTSEEKQKILEAAVKAPSADNLQPWRFKVERDTISVFGERRAPRLPIDETNTLISCGAAIENMVITAHALGLEVHVAYAPGLSGSSHIADLTFAPGGTTSDEAAHALIRGRMTNRSRFSKAPLTQNERDVLIRSLMPFTGEVTLKIMSDRHLMSAVANALSINVRHFLEDPTIHRYFFGNIRWSKEEERHRRDGMSAAALRLGFLERIELKVMSRWPVARFLSALGAGRIGSHEYADHYLCAGAFVTLLAKNGTPEETLTGGRALERLWLAAAGAGLGVQPIAGFAAGQGPGALKGFDMLASTLYRDSNDAYQGLRKALGLGEETILFILRVGKARPIPQDTLRKAPAAVLK